MAETVILIDGEYLRKIFMNNDGHRINLPKFIETIMNKLKINENNLLRTYFYTSPPYQGTKPSPEEKIKYQNFQKFLNFLEKQDSLEVRLGRTEKRGNEYTQKMVDVLLSIDLVELSAKSKIKTAILVAGDSDFVPAVKAAKNNGTKIILVCSQNKGEYHYHLWKEADRRFFVDKDIIEQCSY